MRLTIVLAIFLMTPSLLPTQYSIRALGRYFQDLCLSRSQKSQKFKQLTSTLICGKRLERSSQTHSNLARLGLLHVFVISGAHLLVFHRVLRKFIPLFLLNLLLLPLLVALGGCGAPSLRAYFHIVFNHWIPGSQANPLLSQGLPILLCIALEPSFLNSISLPLSTIAVAFLSLPIRSFTLKLSILYIGMSPIFLYFSLPYPLSIFVNLVFSPVLFIVLYPLSLLTWLVPIVASGTQTVLAPINWLLNSMAIELPPPVSVTAAPTFSAWLIAFVCFIACWVFRIHFWRSKFRHSK